MPWLLMSGNLVGVHCLLQLLLKATHKLSQKEINIRQQNIK